MGWVHWTSIKSSTSESINWLLSPPARVLQLYCEEITKLAGIFFHHREKKNWGNGVLLGECVSTASSVLWAWFHHTKIAVTHTKCFARVFPARTRISQVFSQCWQSMWVVLFWYLPSMITTKVSQQTVYSIFMQTIFGHLRIHSNDTDIFHSPSFRNEPSLIFHFY